MSGLSFEIVSTTKPFNALLPDWSRLCSLTAQPRLMQSPAWLGPWWEVFGDKSRELRVIAVRESSRLVGVAPFLARTHRYRPGIPFRRLELLGSGENEADEIASDYLGITSEAGKEKPVAEKVVEALYSKEMPTWDELVCERMTAVSTATSEFVWALGQKKSSFSIQPDGKTFYIPLPSSWEEYLASLSSSRRYRVKRALKDYTKWAGQEPELKRVENVSEITPALDTLAELHKERWQENGHEGVFASEKFNGFHQRIVKKLFDAGSLELVWLEVEGKPVVSLYSIIEDESVYFYQSGRKTDVPKRVLLGTVAHALAIKDAIERGNREYDFLAGEARYKQELALASRELISIRAIRSMGLREGTRRIGRGAIRGIRSLGTSLRRTKT